MPVGIKARLAIRANRDLKATTNRLRAAGVTYIREDLSWAAVERRPGEYSWRSTDRWMAQAAKRGLHVIAILNGPPSWVTVRPPSSDGVIEDYAAFAQAVVRRYGRSGTFWRKRPGLPKSPIAYYDIWNEPYVARFWGAPPDPVAYANMFIRVSAALKAVDRRARVMLEADTRVLTPGSPLRPFLGPMLEAAPALGRFVDAVSVHPYQGGGASPRVCTPFQPPRGIAYDWLATATEFCRIRDVRRILDAGGLEHAELWVTEIGWSTASEAASAVTEETQARYVRQTFQLLRRDLRNLIDGFVWYEYQGPGGDPYSREAHFGLVRANGTRKPGWLTFVDQVRRGVRR